MIRINLLPTKAVVKATTIRAQAIVAGAVVLLSLIGVFWWMHNINSRIAQLDKDIVLKKEELKKVEEARKKLESIKKLNDNLKRKLEVIQNIEKARTGPVWLMDQLSDSISRFYFRESKTGKVTWRYLDDRVFLQTLKITSGKVDMAGMALNNTYLVAFLNNLKTKSDLFQKVVLVYSDNDKYAKALVKKFQVTCEVNLNAKPYVGGPTEGPGPGQSSSSEEPAGSVKAATATEGSSPSTGGGR